LEANIKIAVEYEEWRMAQPKQNRRSPLFKAEPDKSGGPPKPGPVTISEIAFGACNVPIERLGTVEQRRITAVLTRLGWVRGRKEVGSRRQLWVKA
jgi:hypothetical protein